MGNFGSVTQEFKKGKDIINPLVDRQFGYAAPLLDLVGISTEFSWTTTANFCFTYTPEGVAALPRGLHVRLCHTVLVNLFLMTL